MLLFLPILLSVLVPRPLKSSKLEEREREMRVSWEFRCWPRIRQFSFRGQQSIELSVSISLPCSEALGEQICSALISIRKLSAHHSRSNDGILLEFPRGKMLRSFGSGCFAAAAPTLWSVLPLVIRKSRSLQHFNYKTSLKTYLLKLAFAA